MCEGGVDVVGVVTPLVRGGVLLEVHEKEEEGEDGEGQIEVESERGELKERRTCTWMTSDGTQNLSQMVHVTQHQK